MCMVPDSLLCFVFCLEQSAIFSTTASFCSDLLLVVLSLCSSPPACSKPKSAKTRRARLFGWRLPAFFFLFFSFFSFLSFPSLTWACRQMLQKTKNSSNSVLVPNPNPRPLTFRVSPQNPTFLVWKQCLRFFVYFFLHDVEYKKTHGVFFLFSLGFLFSGSVFSWFSSPSLPHSSPHSLHSLLHCRR